MLTGGAVLLKTKWLGEVDLTTALLVPNFGAPSPADGN